MPTDWPSLIGTDVERESWSDCLDLFNNSDDANVVFRGHGCFDWTLATTLERGLLDLARNTDLHRYALLREMAADRDTEQWALERESELTQYFRSSAKQFGISDVPSEDDNLAWWELMQHHGAPTRLMDWSRSPLIALWFALDSHIDGNDMALWVYHQGISDRNHAQARITLLKAPEYEALDDRERQNRLVQLARSDGNPALIPIDPRAFQRADAQASVLTVSPSIGVGRDADSWIRGSLAIRVRLRECWKPEMAATCQDRGLCRAGLFRDLDNLGAHVTSHFRVGEPLVALPVVKN